MGGGGGGGRLAWLLMPLLKTTLAATADQIASQIFVALSYRVTPSIQPIPSSQSEYDRQHQKRLRNWLKLSLCANVLQCLRFSESNSVLQCIVQNILAVVDFWSEVTFCCTPR
jgi:hypothetical protein